MLRKLSVILGVILVLLVALVAMQPSVLASQQSIQQTNIIKSYDPVTLPTLIEGYGFETGTLDEFGSTGGTVSASTTQHNTGSYSLKVNPTAGTGSVIVSGDLKESFYLYIDTEPNVDCGISTNGNTGLFLTTDRYIKYYYSGTLKITSSLQLSLAHWYRISLSSASSNGACALYIDGSSTSGGTSVNGGASALSTLGTTTTCTTVLYFDDYASSSTAGTTDLGDIRTIVSIPNAAGTYSNFDTPTGSATHYLNVNDTPGSLNDATYNQQAGNGGVVDTYNIQDTTTLSISNVCAVRVFIRTKLGASGGGTGQGMEVYDGGLYFTAESITGSIAWFKKFYAAPPSGGSWTDAKFNSFEIGIMSTGGSKDTFIYTAWAMVSYAVPPGNPSSLASPTQGLTTIDLTWTKGTQADETLIRYRDDGTYPTSTSDGTQGYLGTDSSHQLTGLSAGTTYKIRAWAYSSPLDLYSSGTSDLTQATLSVSAPTVIVSAATSIASTTARLNGEVTNLNGNASATVTVYYGTTDHQGTAVGWDSNAAPTSPAQPQGAATFYLDVSGLTAGTTYWFAAKAVGNVSGTGWTNPDQSFPTIPAAPTNVAATDGTFSTKVVVTWTKSTGATKYKVLRGAVNDSGDLGDVATYDDTAGAAPTITPGTADATDGSSTAHVTLTLSGESASNGSTESYTVYAGNASGYSAASSADNGYKGTTTLTYQWQMSDADSDANYNTNLSGGTTNPFDATTGVPAPSITPGTATATDGSSTAHVTLSLSGQTANDGAKRYFRCAVAMSGATTQYSTGNEGYIGVGSLTYAWYRSAGDSDASYSAITGGTTDPYDDTEPVPTITGGTATATNGSSTAHVTLSLSGQQTNLDKRYFKCYESATGASSQYSTADEGWIGVGSLTYQWYRSAGDSDASYSSIGGATTTPYDDTVPVPTITAGTASASDGTSTTQVVLSISGEQTNLDKRYYKCYESATGASSVYSSADEGWIGVGSITYVWYRSSGDADSGYSALGATTNPYNDTTAPAPTITPGTADASDGTSYIYVVLTLSGMSGNNGAGRYYYCTESATGAADADTNHDRGYRGTTTLTFQWERSALDTDANYSTIAGGTTNPYNDTAAPGGGVKRYFRCAVSMTGASSENSTADEGWKAVMDISNTPSSINFGVLQPSTTYYSGGGAYSNPVTDAQCHFTLTNDGVDTVKININETNPTGGVGWTLVASSPGANEIVDKVVYSGQNPASALVLTTGEQQFLATLYHYLRRKSRGIHLSPNPACILIWSRD